MGNLWCTCTHQLPGETPSTMDTTCLGHCKHVWSLPLLLGPPHLHLSAFYREKRWRWSTERATHTHTHLSSYTSPAVTLQLCCKRSLTNPNAGNFPLYMSDVNADVSCHGEKKRVQVIAVNLRGSYFYTPSWRNTPQQTFSPSRFIFKVFKSRICHIHCRKAGLMKTESVWCNVYQFFLPQQPGVSKAPYSTHTHFHTYTLPILPGTQLWQSQCWAELLLFQSVCCAGICLQHTGLVSSLWALKADE